MISLLRFLPLVLAALLPVACSFKTPAEPITALQAGKTFNRQGSFMLGPNDQLDIFVFGEERLSGRFTISPTGTLSFPLIAPMNVAGMNTTQLSRRLEGALDSYIKGPRVAVSIPSVRSFQVFFQGEVARVGAVNLTSETNLLQAISMAGGLNSFATGRLVLVRQIGHGKVKRYAMQYEDLLAGDNQVDSITLETGDVIVAE